MADTVRYHAIVSGRVQGVWFRAHTQETAHDLGLTGWVRNLPDGTVETEFQGPPPAVDRMRRWLETGPPTARVTGVQAREVPVVPGETGFHIRR